MFMMLFMLLPIAGMVYSGWHLWALLPLSALWKAVIIALGTLCFLTLLLDFNGSLERMPLPLSKVLYTIGTSSVFVLMYVVMAFLLLDLGRLVHVVPKAWLYHNWVTTAALAGLLLTVFVCGNIHYYNKVRVPITLSAPRLPHDIKVVMLSDLHLGYHNTRADLAEWVDLINAEHPDFILIAGDIIDISTRPLMEEGMAEEFRRLQAPVLACPGNHEYYARMPKARQFYKDAGITLLCDTGVMVQDVLVIGRDDRSNRHYRQSLRYLKSHALSPNEPDSARQAPMPQPGYTIVMDHQPYHLEEAEEAGIDFQLSGHTHRGQVWPVSWITDALYECSWGKHQRGNTHYYISSGIGIWGGKFRIGTQSEYVVATLKSK
ncbi:MAG: metallophosphoesterase [Prevotella sp.]|nr:metallophosphoesterase [Prevotella sp.]